MPLKLEDAVMVTSPTGNGIIVMGGMTESEEDSNHAFDSNAIFELSDSMVLTWQKRRGRESLRSFKRQTQWTKLKQFLQQNASYGPLAIPIPDALVYQKIQTKNKRRKL